MAGSYATDTIRANLADHRAVRRALTDVIKSACPIAHRFGCSPEPFYASLGFSILCCKTIRFGGHLYWDRGIGKAVLQSRPFFFVDRIHARWCELDVRLIVSTRSLDAATVLHGE